jgi:DNA-3-methyladenine glycosylase II
MNINNKEAISILQQDPNLKEIIMHIDLPPIPSTHDVFNDLVSCIVEQQIHYRSTKQLFARMLRQAGLEYVSLENFHEFEAHGLPAAKLSASKYETLLRVIEHWQLHEINWQEQSDETVYEILGSIKGVGKWSADMILMYTLRRPNIFPEDDYHLQQIMTRLYGLDHKSKLKQKMKAVADNWGEHKSLAVLYLLAWKQQAKVKASV